MTAKKHHNHKLYIYTYQNYRMNSNISEREQSTQLSPPKKRGPSKKDKVKGCGKLKDNDWIKTNGNTNFNQQNTKTNLFAFCDYLNTF